MLTILENDELSHMLETIYEIFFSNSLHLKNQKIGSGD